MCFIPAVVSSNMIFKTALMRGKFFVSTRVCCRLEIDPTELLHCFPFLEASEPRRFVDDSFKRTDRRVENRFTANTSLRITATFVKIGVEISHILPL